VSSSSAEGWEVPPSVTQLTDTGNAIRRSRFYIWVQLYQPQYMILFTDDDFHAHQHLLRGRAVVKVKVQGKVHT